MPGSYLEAWREATAELQAALEELDAAGKSRDKKRRRDAERRYKDAGQREDTTRAAYYAALKAIDPS